MCPALWMGFLGDHSGCLDPLQQLARFTVALALCFGRQTQQQSTLLWEANTAAVYPAPCPPGNSDHCSFPASPSCLREHLEIQILTLICECCFSLSVKPPVCP